MTLFSSEERERATTLLGRIAGGATFLQDAADAFKDTWFLKAIGAAAPVAKAAGESAVEASAIVKFVVTFLERVTKGNPAITDLAFVACSTAYQQSLLHAIATVGAPASTNFNDQVRIGLDVFASKEKVDFETLSYDDLLAHEFLRIADETVLVYARDAGYDNVQRTYLIGVLHRMFGRKFRALLSHPGLRKKFEPLTEFLQMNNAAVGAYATLELHANYQRALFEATPVLKTEPFALRDIYIETECGRLTWSELRNGLQDRSRGKLFDPFDDEFGGRHPLLDTVLGLIADPTFDDAIVIQGVAGSGKSSFTLRLAVALLERGLLPIRVRLRDVLADKPISEALARALPLSEDKAETPGQAVREAFMSGRLFEEVVPYNDTRICPYVLILDGWDEISISASEGFRQRVEEMLGKVRSEYLAPGSGRIRVILTGRPSQDVNDTGFFRDHTPILTVRHLKPADVRKLVERVRDALEKPTISGKERWALPPAEAIEPVLQQYQQSYERPKARVDQQFEVGDVTDVLGLPLLAHIALRLFGVWKGDLKTLIQNRTALYRSLVDITCEKGGQPSSEELDLTDRPRLAPEELRRLLRDTAVAMTIYGADNIPAPELERRLRSSFEELQARVSAAVQYPLSTLMISFFFKGGFRELGCEFVHKSFREYLFAEAVIEILKKYAIDHPEPFPERPLAFFWKDFDETDPRFNLSQQLMETLAAQWMSAEVDQHLGSLIVWEINRAVGDEINPSPGTPTERVSIAQWLTIRDTLADLWDWWGEGVHLRPQPRIVEGVTTYVRSRIDKAVEWCTSPPERGGRVARPPRTTTLDAHLGDALFRLACETHYWVACRTGWLEGSINAEAQWDGVLSRGAGCRRYQTRIVHPDGEWVVFAPSGPDPLYFHFYSGRIDSAGYRPGGPFPRGVSCWGLDLRHAYLRLSEPTYSRGHSTFFTLWNLSQANAVGCSFAGLHLSFFLAEGADFTRSSFRGGSVVQVVFRDATLTSAVFADVTFADADMRGAELTGIDWSNAVNIKTITADIPILEQKR